MLAVQAVMQAMIQARRGDETGGTGETGGSTGDNGTSSGGESGTNEILVCDGADADQDGLCDDEDFTCNRDGQPLICRRLAQSVKRALFPKF